VQIIDMAKYNIVPALMATPKLELKVWRLCTINEGPAHVQ